jgi:hypothetical protein
MLSLGPEKVSSAPFLASRSAPAITYSWANSLAARPGQWIFPRCGFYALVGRAGLCDRFDFEF